MKDRRHYGTLVQDSVIEVTPEQAGTWLTARPPAPIMWSRDVPDNEKSHRLAAAMLAGEWDNTLPVEPVMVSADHGHVLGGHHRLSAVMHTEKPQDIRVQFYSKPPGWDTKIREIKQAEVILPPCCHICGWHGTPESIAAHVVAAHGD
jgi:hypothetical protein